MRKVLPLQLIIFPALEQSGTIAIYEYIFRDEAAIHVSFGVLDVAKVMSDLARDTDVVAARVRAAAV